MLDPLDNVQVKWMQQCSFETMWKSLPTATHTILYTDSLLDALSFRLLKILWRLLHLKLFLKLQILPFDLVQRWQKYENRPLIFSLYLLQFPQFRKDSHISHSSCYVLHPPHGSKHSGSVLGKTHIMLRVLKNSVLYKKLYDFCFFVCLLI